MVRGPRESPGHQPKTGLQEEAQHSQVLLDHSGLTMLGAGLGLPRALLPRALPLQVWPTDQQHLHHLGVF